MPSIGGIKAGSAYVVIGAIDDTGKMLSKIGRRLNKWGDSLKNFGLDLGFKTALALTPAALGLGQFMKYEDLMLAVQARTGATAAEMEDLGNKARQMGLDIGISATQIAQSMNELSTRGFSTKQIGDMTRPIALLSKATGKGSEKDMEQAAQLMSIAIQAFKLDTAQALPIANKLTIAANESNFALDDLREALSHIGPLAHQMGMSLEETVAILAQMRNVEIDAASAGIGLRNILLNSANTKNAEDFNKALAGFGIGAMEFMDNAGNLKDGAQLIFEVFAKLKGLGTGQRASLLEGLFGKRAITPSIAAGSSQEKFTAIFNKMLNAAADTAEKIAHKMESGLGGSFRRIINQVLELSISFEKTLAPALGVAGKQLEKLLRITSKWIKIHPAIVTGVSASAVALLGLAGAMVTTGIAAKTLGFAVSALSVVFLTFDIARKVVVFGMTTISAAFSTLLVGWSLVLTAAQVGVTAIGALRTVFAIVTGSITAFFTAIEVAALAIGYLGAGVSLAYLTIALTSIVSIGYMLYKIIEKSSDALVVMSGKFMAGLGRIRTFFGNFASYIADTFSSLWSTIVSAGTAAFEQLSQNLSFAFNLAQAGQFEASWKIAIASVSTAFMDFWDAVSVKAGETFTDILAGFFQIFTEMSNTLSRVIAKTNPLNAMAIPLQELNEGMGAGLNSMAKTISKRRQGEDKARDDAEQRKMWRERDLNDVINGIKEDMPEAPEDNKNNVPNIINELGSGTAPAAMNAGHMKPLEGLEKGTLEAAKAAWEGSGDAGQRQLDLLAGILNGLIALNQNLQVA